MAADEHPYDRVLRLLGERGAQIRHLSAGRVRATCPAHPDRKPSLAITRRDQCVLLHCFAGCRKGEPARALGLRPADLFIGSRPMRERATIVATYDYVNREGDLLAQKGRFDDPKRFAWRRLDPDTRSGWRWGLEGIDLPPLYRWPTLVDARVAIICEGEKAADRLSDLGLVATCGPWGASVWKGSDDLLEAVSSDAAIVILADRDPAGERHAERVAADLHEHRRNRPIVLRVVRLPSLPPGGDVVDFLEAGHTLEELLGVIASTPMWSPQAAVERRAKHRAALAAARQQAHRRRARAERAMRPVDQTHEKPTPAAQHADAVGGALRAVQEELGRVGAPQSGHDLKRALAGRHTRDIVDEALKLGREPGGALVCELGARRAKLYSVRTAEPSPDIQRVTDRGGQSASVRRAKTVPDTHISNSSEQKSVSECPVTLSRGHAGERSFLTLQDDSLTQQNTPRDRATPDTGGVTRHPDTQTPDTPGRMLEAGQRREAESVSSSVGTGCCALGTCIDPTCDLCTRVRQLPQPGSQETR